MDDQNESNRKWDGFGTVLASLTLVGGCLISFMGCRVLAASGEMYTEMGNAELPGITKYAMIVQTAHGFDVVALLMLALGIYLLVMIKDRPRANLYAGLTAMLLGLGGGGLFVIAAIPLTKMVSMMAA